MPYSVISVLVDVEKMLQYCNVVLSFRELTHSKFTFSVFIDFKTYFSHHLHKNKYKIQENIMQLNKTRIYSRKSVSVILVIIIINFPFRIRFFC